MPMGTSFFASGETAADSQLGGSKMSTKWRIYTDLEAPAFFNSNFGLVTGFELYIKCDEHLNCCPEFRCAGSCTL